jgi:DNA polymerase III subunit epsilon
MSTIRTVNLLDSIALGIDRVDGTRQRPWAESFPGENMQWLYICAAIVFLVVLAFLAYRVPRADTRDADQLRRNELRLSALPDKFIVFDLETTGLDSTRHEIIEIGAIKVNRESDTHDTFQALVKPIRRVPRKITHITGISQEMVDRDGERLETAIKGFAAFAGNLPLVAFNAEFDMAFLENSARQHDIVIGNPASCALKMARRAWPGRQSYRLSDLARDGGLSDVETHRTLGDCKRTLLVYTAAFSRLQADGDVG